MTRLRATLLSAIGGFVLLTGLAWWADGPGNPGVPGPAAQVALAGGSGQQLDFSDGIGYVYTVTVSGDNQYGGCCYVTHSFATPYYHDNYLAGWWWQGFVTIDEYGSSSNNLGEEWTSVPVSQSSDWWWYCDYQGGGSSSTGGAC